MINWSDFPSDSLLNLPASTRPSSVHISHISTQFPLYFPALNDLCSYVSKYYICISIWISSFPFTSMTKKEEEKNRFFHSSPGEPEVRSALPFLFLHFNVFLLLFFNFLPWFCQIYLSHLKSEEYLSEESALPHFPP